MSIIFDKALEEGHFCKMYAQLCRVIQDRMPDFQDPAGCSMQSARSSIFHEESGLACSSARACACV